MWNFNDVQTISYRHNYVFRIVFDNGMTGDVDLAPYLDRGPIFAPLRDLRYFQSARVGNGTISWPNGADIAPETLYEKIETANQALQPTLADSRD